MTGAYSFMCVSGEYAIPFSYVRVDPGEQPDFHEIIDHEEEERVPPDDQGRGQPDWLHEYAEDGKACPQNRGHLSGHEQKKAVLRGFPA